MKRFIKTIIIFEIILLTLILPLIIYAAHQLSYIFLITDYSIIYAIVCIFAIEGIVAIARLIYHSYFWQKPFNLMPSVILTIEAATNIVLALHVKESQTLLKIVLFNKLASGSSIVFISILMLKRLYQDASYPGDKSIDYSNTMRGFIKHSAIMWINTTLRSLSERNFLVPLLTFIAGPGPASIFKIANEGALLFQRVVLKTIGTTDTSLLTHIQTLPNAKKLLPVAFKKLTTKIAALCIPLLGIIGFIVCIVSAQTRNTIEFQLFILIAVSYLIESLLLPFERVLEVHKKYTYLIGAYLFYTLLLIVIIYLTYISWIGLLSFILYLCIVRLVSTLFMAYVGKQLFYLQMPLRLYISFSLYTSLLVCLFYYAVQYTSWLQGYAVHFARVVMKYL